MSSKDNNASDRRIVLLVLGMSYTAVSMLYLTNISPEITGFLSLFLLVSFVMAWRGILQVIGVIAPLVGLLGLTWLLFRNFGIRDTALVGFPAVIIAASLLNGRRGTITFGGASLLVICLLGIAEMNGWVVNIYTERNSITDYLAVSIAIILITLLQWAVIGRLEENIHQAQCEVAERQRAEAQLQASLAEKEVLLKEIHHRVKNNMQVIVSILNLQASYVTDVVMRNILRDGQNRVRSMAMVHEQLYKSKNLADIDFRDYLQHLASTLFNSYSPETSKVNLTFDIGEISLAVDTAVPYGLIASELISNALKHAFPNNREGEIIISLQSAEDGLLKLSVQDNGVGIPVEKDWQKTESLGMQLVQSLVKQIHGTIEVTRLNPGMRFAVSVTQPK